MTAVTTGTTGTLYAGTALLTRAALRRDRLLASIWIALLTVVAYASAAATASLYPTVADQVAAARAINASPAVVALYGPILDERSLGELAMTKMTVLYAVFVALLLVVVVRRHTRGDEESGRAELVAGTAVGPGRRTGRRRPRGRAPLPGRRAARGAGRHRRRPSRSPGRSPSARPGPASAG